MRYPSISFGVIATQLAFTVDLTCSASRSPLLVSASTRNIFLAFEEASIIATALPAPPHPITIADLSAGSKDPSSFRDSINPGPSVL